MITIELVRRSRRCEPELVARVRADGDVISVDGPEPELHRQKPDCPQPAERQIDRVRRRPRGVGARARCVVRSPYLSARVVEDTNPLPDVEMAPANVREPG